MLICTVANLINLHTFPAAHTTTLDWYGEFYVTALAIVTMTFICIGDYIDRKE